MGSQSEANWQLMEDLVHKLDFLIYSPEPFPLVQAALTFGKFAEVGLRWFRWLLFEVSFLASDTNITGPMGDCSRTCMQSASVPLFIPAFYELLSNKLMGDNSLQSVEHLINPMHVFMRLDIFCQLKWKPSL